MPQHRVQCHRQIPRKAAEVWQVLAGFDLGWHPGIAQCDVFRGPSGALLRRFKDVSGQVYEEQRSYISHSDRVLGYELLDGIDGLLRYCAEVSVENAGPHCRVTWTANISAQNPRGQDIARGTTEIFETALTALATAAMPKSIVSKKPRPAPLSERILSTEPKLHLLHGPMDPDEAPLVLFLHGIGGNATNWTDQLSQLGPKYRVAALNLRGYGGSHLGAEPTRIEDHCADILAVQTAFGAHKLVLVGLSLGAWIATSFAMRHSDQLAGLVLAGGCTGMSEAPANVRDSFRTAREAPLDAGKTPADFAADVVTLIAGPQATPSQRASLLGSMSEIPANTYRDALHCFCNPTERFDFDRIDCPVLMMTGAHDTLAPPTEIRDVANTIRHARATRSDVQFEALPAAGHVCNLEAPDDFNAYLETFLQRLPGTVRGGKLTALERQKAKHDHILSAAHIEFCATGFDGASMDRIAERADVSKPTLYQYFGNKDQLFSAVLSRGKTHIIAPLLSTQGSLADRLWRFAWTYADFVLRPDMLSLARLILGEAQRRPEAAKAYHDNGPGRALEGLVDFIMDQAAKGNLKTDAPDLAAQDLWSLILSGPRDHHLHHVDSVPDNSHLSRVISHGLEIFLRIYATDPQEQIKILYSLTAPRQSN